MLGSCSSRVAFPAFHTMQTPAPELTAVSLFCLYIGLPQSRKASVVVPKPPSAPISRSATKQLGNLTAPTHATAASQASSTSAAAADTAAAAPAADAAAGEPKGEQAPRQTGESAQGPAADATVSVEVVPHGHGALGWGGVQGGCPCAEGSSMAAAS
jgi:hypothetical protein